MCHVSCNLRKGSFEALHYYTQSRPSVTGARTGGNVLHYQITHRDITIIALLMRLDHMDTHKSFWVHKNTDVYTCYSVENLDFKGLN